MACRSTAEISTGIGINMTPDSLEIIAGGSGAEGSMGYWLDRYDSRGGCHYMRIGVNHGVDPKGSCTWLRMSGVIFLGSGK
jgi:hypothetical protein